MGAVFGHDGRAPLEATDGDLLVRIAERNREAFEVLYRRYARSVFGFALRRVRDRQSAEDVSQETFAAVWRSAASYRPERGAAASWLYAIVRNATVDRLRARFEPLSGQAAEVASAEPGPAERADEAFVAWRVHRALEDLPDGEREAIELAYWGDMSQSELAEYLGVPLGTVKTRTRRGLAQLASMLDGELT